MPPQLSRLMIIFGFLIAAFVATRWVLEPESFHEFGHYRGKALSEIAANPTRYVSSKACEECHDEQAKLHVAGPHARISCQTCHGPGAEHVTEPSAANITKPTIETTCLRCHAQNSARPARFPQVNIKDHAEGKSCLACHPAHNPSEIHEPK
jgi:hypothetical protein